MTALKLRMMRIDRGLSREALAQKAGISSPTVKRLEEGELPSPAIAFKVAGFFDLRPTELWPELIEDREPAA